MEQKNRDYSLDILRIIACVMVVGIHTSAEGWYGLSPSSYTWTVLNFYDTLCRPGVPLFLMISGSLFLRKEKIDYKRLWTKNILHLLVIYIIWNIFYAIMNTGFKKSLTDPSLIWEIIIGPKPQYHLWYLRTLMNLYAIAPLLWALVHAMDKRLLKYYMIIFFIFGSLRRTVYEYPYMPGWMHEQINLFIEMDLVGYSAYFMLGYFLVDKDIADRFSTKSLFITYICTMLAAAGLNQWISIVSYWPVQTLYGNFAIPVVIESICLFLIITKKYSDIQLSMTQQKWLVRVSTSTLFVYLIHPFVIQRLEIYFHFYTTNYNVLFSVPAMVILVCVLSFAVGMVLERIPILNRIL